MRGYDYIQFVLEKASNKILPQRIIILDSNLWTIIIDFINTL